MRVLAFNRKQEDFFAHRGEGIIGGDAAERTPHAFKRAGVGVEDNHALIPVSVGHEQFVRTRVHEHVCWPPEIRGVGIGLWGTPLADLHDELTSSGELQDLIFGAIAPNPDKTLRVDIDAVLGLRPLITDPRPAPTLHEVTVRIELKHRRRGPRLLLVAQSIRPLQHP